MATSAPVDPGATPVTDRALAPDIARGGMLLLIALANVHTWGWGHSLGVRAYPRVVEGADRWVALLQMTFVDGRAYPLFGLLFGYGVVQLSWRRGAVGLPVQAVTRLVRRRGFWMIVIGAMHGVLLWPGEIIGAYGLLAVIMAGLLVKGRDVSLIVTAAVGAFLVTVFYSASGLTIPGDPQAFLPSITVADPVAAVGARAVDWLTLGFAWQAFGVFGAVALGAWAARRQLLDDPERHRRLLVRAAVVGLAVAVVLGLPMALLAAQLWTSPSPGALLLAGALHGLGGYAGGIGYAALFGLLAIRLSRRGTGPFTAAVQACGQRSMSCYLAQSVAFAIVLPAWTLGLGEDAHLWQLALVGFGAWLVILVVAAVSARAGIRGPAEVLLRRLTYGPRPVRVSAGAAP